ncbi:MAG: hypothetical protein LBP98_07500, partial [Tannerella sp.]|nr:hypothetical protein [Tannerella sp.]
RFILLIGMDDKGRRKIRSASKKNCGGVFTQNLRNSSSPRFLESGKSTTRCLQEKKKAAFWGSLFHSKQNCV